MIPCFSPWRMQQRAERANERERERERVLGKQGESRKRGKRVVIPSCTPWLSQCIAMATDPETPCGRRAIGLCFPMIVIMYPRFRWCRSQDVYHAAKGRPVFPPASFLIGYESAILEGFTTLRFFPSSSYFLPSSLFLRYFFNFFVPSTIPLALRSRISIDTFSSYFSFFFFHRIEGGIYIIRRGILLRDVNC